MIGNGSIGSTYWGGYRPGATPDASFRVTVNGVRREGLLSESSPLGITLDINTRDSCRFVLIDRSPGLTLRVAPGDEVVIEEGHARIFGGQVEYVRASTDPSGKNQAKWLEIEATDFSRLTDRPVVAERFDTEGQTLGDVVRAIVANYLAAEGISDEGVQDGPELGPVAFSHVNASNCLDELAELTGFFWFVDPYKTLHFCDRATFTAPWSIGDAVGERRHISLELSEDRSDFRSRQILIGGHDVSENELVERFRGDGETRTFTTSRPIAAVPTVRLNGVDQTVGIKDVESGRQWYWNKGSDTVTQDEAGTAVEDSDTLEVRFRFEFPIIVTVDDSAAIAERQAIEGGTGIYAHVESGESVDDADLAIQRAEGLLRRFARVKRQVRITTDTPGIRPGHLLSITQSGLGLDEAFLVETVELVNELERFRMRYQITGVSGESFGGWAEFFKRAARAGRPFSIRENDVILVAPKVSDQVELEDAVDVDIGNTLSTWSDDDYTTFLVGPALVGLPDMRTPDFPDV